MSETTFSNTDPITINDNAVATPYPSSITVSALTGTVTKVVVAINGFSHTFPSDVLMLLVGPTGATCAIWGRIDTGDDVSNLTIVLTDDATGYMPDSVALSSGTFKPTFYPFNNPFSPSTFPAPAPDPGGDVTISSSGAITLSTFLNIDPNGQWDLYVFDEFSPDSGSISGGWSLTFTTGGPRTPNLHFDRTHNAESGFGSVTPNNFSVGTQWAICTTDPLVNEGDCFQWKVAGEIRQVIVGMVADPDLNIGESWGDENDSSTRFEYGETILAPIERVYFDHPHSPETPPGNKTEWPYNQETDVFKIVRNSDGLSFYRNNVFLDKRLAGSSPLLPDPMPLLYPAVLGAYQFNGADTPAIWSGITNAQSCAPIPASYNCTPDGCVDPGDGSGTYATLEECETACGITPSWNCVDGVCVDPGNGSGTFATLDECRASGCESTISNAIQTVRFDAGEGVQWYLVTPPSDGGNELRGKNIKTMRATGKFTNASMKAYGYNIGDEIDTDALEAGTGASTRAQSLPDSNNVAQSPRKPINVKGAGLSCLRIEGDDRGKVRRDEVHELVSEWSIQDARR